MDHMSRGLVVVFGAWALGCVPGTTPGVETSGSETIDATGTSQTSTSDTGPGSTPASYCADRFIGGIDRLQLWRRDQDSDTCTLIRLVHLDGGWEGPSLEINDEQFAVETIVLQDGAAQCGMSTGSGVPAIAAEGTVTLHPQAMDWSPAAVDVDASMSFDSTQPWIVAEVEFRATGLDPSTSCLNPRAWSEGE